MPQHVRARDAVVAVSAADREHAQLPRQPLQEDPRDSRGELQGAQGRLQLRRDHRDVRERPTKWPAARIAPGLYRNITGNSATALGFVAAAVKSGRPLFLGSYPITPASDILHELAGFKNFPVYTFQAEDEIAGVCAAIGAAFGGSIAITTTSGPGMNLKAEAVGLAVKVELPLVITDIQRAGPSTGMPTKPEQADLLQSMYGRHGESPIPIIAASTPADCFDCAYEAVRIAVKYMTPVILLTDGQLANGAEPWLLPDADKLPPNQS